MKPLILVFILPFWFPLNREKKENCKDVKYGTFYYYSKKTGNSYVVIRKDSLQIEIANRSHDSSFWKINWTTDCSCKIEFDHAFPEMLKAKTAFFKMHPIIAEILDVTSDFYLLKQNLDSAHGRFLSIDTVWRKPKK